MTEKNAASGFETFRPPELFLKESNLVKFMERIGVNDYNSLYSKSVRDPAWFWSTFEKDARFIWFSDYSRVLDMERGFMWARWFVEGRFNIAYNCLDRQIQAGLGQKIAYYFEDEVGSTSSITYSELNLLVNKIANSIRALGVKKGDRICTYLSNTPVAIAVLLASAKIGAIHNVIFSGLGTEALRSRLRDSSPKIIVSSCHYYRRGNLVSPADQLAEVLSHNDPELDSANVLLDSKSGEISNSIRCRKVYYLGDLISHESGEFECELTNSEDPLFILYTSGTTGKPKAVVHVHAGFGVVSAQQTLHPLDMKKGDLLFWPTDIGWISAHIWVIYGLLLSGGTALLYDGALDYPNSDRWFELAEKYQATICGLSPTAARILRSLPSPADENLGYDLSRIKVMAVTGEPIDTKSWMWLYNKIGHSNVFIFNNSGGTEIGAAILGTMPVLAMKPASIGGPQLGFAADVVDEDGNHVEGKSGYLVIKKPWPSMTRGLWRDQERYEATYWSRFPGIWYHGDWALIDKSSFWFILGRVDDIIKVAGHRIGAAEVEDVLSSHPSVAETAVIGKPDALKGQRIVAFVVLRSGFKPSSEMSEALLQHVSIKMGKIARPSNIIFRDALPKTPTGKIMRNLLRNLPINDRKKIRL